MENSNSNENSHQPEDISTMFNSASEGHCSQTFSWKRTMKILVCTLSVLWLVMLHVGGIPIGGIDNVKIAVITVATVFPILLCLRPPLMYFLGFPFFFVVALTLWLLWTTLWTVPLPLRIPPLRMPP